MPCGLALLDPSAMVGIPVVSENRTVAGIGLPLNNTARLSPAASAEALKLPSTVRPSCSNEIEIILLCRFLQSPWETAALAASRAIKRCRQARRVKEMEIV